MEVLVTLGLNPPMVEYPDSRVVVPPEPIPTMERLKMSLMP